MLLSPVKGKPSSARAGLSLHIISHQPDSISSDQSPSKDLDPAVDLEESPLPSPDPVIIHSQAPVSPDDSPLTGPPPYQAAVTQDHHSPPDQERDEAQPDAAAIRGTPSDPQIADSLSTDDSSVAAHSAISREPSSCAVPRTLSAPAGAQVDSQVSGMVQSESLSADQAEDTYLVQLLEQASALSNGRNMNQNTAGGNTQETHT